LRPNQARRDAGGLERRAFHGQIGAAAGDCGRRSGGTAGKLATQVVRADPLVAPFVKGQQLATLRVTGGGQALVDVPLVALDAVEQAGVLGRTWDAVRLWIK